MAAAGCANPPPRSEEARDGTDWRALVAECQRAQRDGQRREEQLAHQLREERRRSEEMQQKIESLLAIERKLRRRNPD